MLAMNERAIQLKSEVLKALAEPTRLKILECLRGGEKCMCEIVPAIDGEQSNISRHISVMHKNNLMATRKDGVRVMARVRGPLIFEILDRVSEILRNRVKEEQRLFLSIPPHRGPGRESSGSNLRDRRTEPIRAGKPQEKGIF